MKEKDYELAIKLFSEYIDEYPTDPLGYINLSNLFIQLGEYSHAEKLLKRTIELDQSAASAYYTLGNNYFEQNLRSEEHTSELQSRGQLVCRLLLEKKKDEEYKVEYDETNRSEK